MATYTKGSLGARSQWHHSAKLRCCLAVPLELVTSAGRGVFSTLHIVQPVLHKSRALSVTLRAGWGSAMLLQVLNVSTYQELGLAAPESVTVTRITRAVLQYWLFPWNYYHMLAEYLPTLHNHLCKYWGDCDHDPHSDLHILLRNHLKKGVAATEAVKAITGQPITSIWELGNGDATTEVLLVDQMLVGVGIECRMDHLHCKGQWRGKEWKP